MGKRFSFHEISVRRVALHNATETVEERERKTEQRMRILGNGKQTHAHTPCRSYTQTPIYRFAKYRERKRARQRQTAETNRVLYQKTNISSMSNTISFSMVLMRLQHVQSMRSVHSTATTTTKTAMDLESLSRDRVDEDKIEKKKEQNLHGERANN